jgi:carbon-monoxide dehydrogenase medium subunit
MKPAAFTYHDPRSVGEAVDLLASLENAKPLAGGQSLMPMLNFRVAMPEHLVDLNRIAELQGIAEEGDRITIGAMTRQVEVERSEMLRRRCPIFREALAHVGHRQTRNRGTIGGSLAHMDGAAELPIVAMVLDATLQAESRRGRRSLVMAEFPVSYLTTALEADELLVAITIRPWRPRHGYGFEEFARRRGDFAVAAAAALLEIEGTRITRAALALGGVGPGPVRLPDAERALIGAGLGEKAFRAAAAIAAKVDAHSDIHAGGTYRQRLAAVLMLRALRKAGARAAGSEEGERA